MRYNAKSEGIKEAIDRFALMQNKTDIIDIMFDKFRFGPLKIEFFQKEIKNENGRTDNHVLLSILENGNLYIKLNINDFLIEIETADFSLKLDFDDKKNATLQVSSEGKGMLTIGLEEDHWKE